MALKLHKGCNICKLIEAGDTALLKRIYNSSAFKGKKGESQTQIVRDYNKAFTMQGMWLHVKNHQRLTEADLKKAGLDDISERQAKSLIKHVITHQTLTQLVIEKGEKGIKSGKIKVSARDALQAAKLQVDVEERAKDRGAQALETMMRFASGELTSGITSGNNPEPTRITVDSTT